MQLITELAVINHIFQIAELTCVSLCVWSLNNRCMYVGL